MSRVGRELRLEMARRFEEGEVSKAKFCEAEGISVPTLDYWRRQLKNESATNWIRLNVSASQKGFSLL